MRPSRCRAPWGTVLLALSLLTVANCSSDPETAQDFLESGRAYQQEGRHAEAIVQFLNALQKDPEHRDARYQLAQSYLGQQEWRRAEEELRTLLKADPEDTQAALTLGNLYLNAGQGDQNLFLRAQELAEEVLAREPEQVEALILSGNAAAGMRDLTSSQELLERALELDPENLAATVNLAALEALRADYPQAEAFFLKAREIAPQDPRVLLSLFNLYLGTDQLEKGKKILREAFGLHPTDPQVYLTWSRFQYSQGETESAKGVLQQVQELLPEDPMPSLFLADLYLVNGEQSQAEQLLDALREQFPENLVVARKRILLTRTTDPGKARQQAQQLVDEAPQDARAWILLGELEFAAGDYEKAQATFDRPLLTGSAYPEPHFFKGRMAALRGEEDVAMQAYQEAIRVNSRYPPARLALAQIYFRRGLYTDSQAEVDRVLQVRPDELQARLLKVRLRAVDGQTEQAQEELTKLLESHPDEITVQQLAGRFYQISNQLTRAEQHFRRALELRPESAELLKDLVQVHLQRQEPRQAIQAIRNQLSRSETPVQHELLGQVYLAEERLEEAQSAFRRAIELDEERVSSYILLSTTYLQAGKMAAGLGWVENLLEKKPDFAPAHALQGHIYLNQGKLSEAQDHYTRALELNPEDHAAANNLAYVLGEQNQDLELALKWAQSARRMEPENPDYADTLGWIYYKVGRYVLARDQLRFASSNKPQDLLLRYHLGMALWKTGQLPEATEALEQALKSGQAFGEAEQARAALQEIGQQGQ